MGMNLEHSHPEHSHPEHSHVVQRKQVRDRAGISDESFDATFRHLRGINYVDRSILLVDRERIIATPRGAEGAPVVGGIAAAIMHRIIWYDPDFEVQLIRRPSGSSKHTGGSRTSRKVLLPTDVMEVDGIRVTTPVRTAADLGRLKPEWRALAHMDDLHRATKFSIPALLALAVDMKGYRGVRQLRFLGPLVDGKAQSPPESRLRLFLIRQGLPTPETQIEVYLDDFGCVYWIDLGYRAVQVGLEYDGVEHHSSPEDQAADLVRQERLESVGWRLIRVDAAKMRDPSALLNEISEAIRARGGQV